MMPMIVKSVLILTEDLFMIVHVKNIISIQELPNVHLVIVNVKLVQFLVIIVLNVQQPETILI
jgi:hypothetical protein